MGDDAQQSNEDELEALREQAKRETEAARTKAEAQVAEARQEGHDRVN